MDMTYTSCISPPAKNPYIQLHEWQVKFCQGNDCAAKLLAFFIAWHDWKIKHDSYYRFSNDIAERHGDGRPHNQNAYLFFSTKNLINGLMGTCGKKAITTALELLCSLKVIIIHKNPNPRYHFDKTRYFRFYPDVCNRWIKEYYSEVSEINDIDDTDDIYPNEEVTIQVVNMDSTLAPIDAPERDNRQARREPTPRLEEPPCAPRHPAITDTTNNTTKINNPTNARAREGEIFSEHHKGKVAASDKTKPIVDALIAKGMHVKRFYPDSLVMIAQLQGQGATMELFCEAYDKACHSTQGDGFGINYLAKIITEKLKPKKVRAYPNKSPPVQPKYEYQNDFSKGLHWMSDLLQGD
jgi:hypothetical protein